MVRGTHCLQESPYYRGRKPGAQKNEYTYLVMRACLTILLWPHHRIGPSIGRPSTRASIIDLRDKNTVKSAVDCIGHDSHTRMKIKTTRIVPCNAASTSIVCCQGHIKNVEEKQSGLWALIDNPSPSHLWKLNRMLDGKPELKHVCFLSVFFCLFSFLLKMNARFYRPSHPCSNLTYVSPSSLRFDVFLVSLGFYWFSLSIVFTGSWHIK